jgi:energy-coupling factor transporter ATP-binding protein EcfA2
VPETVNSPTDSQVLPHLAEIRLENFKSVVNATVKLSPLTVIVGRNSTGKSTLLQSILMIAQSIMSEVASGEFPFNGDLVRLGTFDEVLNFQNSKDSPKIHIGFSVTVDARTPRMRPSRRMAEGETGAVSWDGYLGRPNEGSNGFAALESFEFELAGPDGSSISSLSVPTVHNEINRRRGPWPVAVDQRALRPGRSLLWVDGRLTENGQNSRVSSVEVLGGLPSAAFRDEARSNVLARQWWDVFRSGLSEEIEKAERKIAKAVSEDRSVTKTNAAVQVAAECLEEFFKIDQNIIPGPVESMRNLRLPGRLSRTERYFYVRFEELDSKKKNDVAASMASLGEAEFRKRVHEKLSDNEAIVDWLSTLIADDMNNEIGRELWSSALPVSSLFRSLKYLGPLRQSPKVVYDQGPNRDDLGTSGEYTAAVLHAHRNREIIAPLPGGRSQSMPLGEALNIWLAELGLVEQAAATDLGRLGIGLTVTPVGSPRSVDLTAVGVGVSQALPVILLCLIARRGSVVLLEQPELHLHPAMQLKLADFLLACAKTGRQIVLETHSEHLVNRLRLRVSEDDSNRTSNEVGLLFADQDELGRTTYKPSQINPLGGLSEDWPKGFLDVGSDEAGQLLRQTVLRQRQISSKKD